MNLPPLGWRKYFGVHVLEIPLLLLLFLFIRFDYALKLGDPVTPPHS